MDALDKHIARRNRQMTLALTIIASLVAIVVESSVISRVWIHPVSGHSGIGFYEIPVITALPLFLCLAMQLGVRKALKSGDLSLKMANTIGMVGGFLILTTYQAIGDMMRLIP